MMNIEKELRKVIDAQSLIIKRKNDEINRLVNLKTIRHEITLDNGYKGLHIDTVYRELRRLYPCDEGLKADIDVFLVDNGYINAEGFAVDNGFMFNVRSLLGSNDIYVHSKGITDIVTKYLLEHKSDYAKYADFILINLKDKQPNNKQLFIKK